LLHAPGHDECIKLTTQLYAMPFGQQRELSV
jgi:hypothetical protein